MTGIYSNGYMEVSAFRLGYDVPRPYWFNKLEELKRANFKCTNKGYDIYLFGKGYLIDSPYIFKENNKIVIMNSSLFYNTFEFVRPYNSEDLHKDCDLINKLFNEKLIDDYFEIIKVM